MKNIFGLFSMVLALLLIGCSKDPLFTDAGTITDTRDNHVYKTAKIGEQVWMAENLAFLPSVSPSPDGSEAALYYYVYGYQGSSAMEAKAAANFAAYGVLYNWEAAKAACPSGWHLPGNEEWRILTDHLDTVNFTAGGKMKETGTSHWLSPNTGATNECGLTAIPGGERSVSGGFNGLGEYAEFWSSTVDEWSRSILIRVLLSTDAFLWSGWYDRSDGFSVRCLKNQGELSSLKL